MPRGDCRGDQGRLVPGVRRRARSTARTYGGRPAGGSGGSGSSRDRVATAARAGWDYYAAVKSGLAARSGAGVEADCFRQLCLALVKGPELFRAQIECRSDVEGVKRTDTKGCPVAAHQVSASFPCRFRKTGLRPDTNGTVVLKFPPKAASFRRRNSPSKNVAINGMGHFRFVQRCNPHRRMLHHPMNRLRRVHVLKVVRDYEARVCVDRQ
jgi:hypothetical protein